MRLSSFPFGKLPKATFGGEKFDRLVLMHVISEHGMKTGEEFHGIKFEVNKVRRKIHDTTRRVKTPLLLNRFER